MALKHGDIVYQQWSRREYVQRIPGNWHSCGYETATEWYTFGEPFRFRAEPVPYIHKYRKSPRGYYRHPRTTQELRWIEPHSEFVRIRGRRSKNYLPTWYDDRIIADNRQHGWKRTKKRRQWMKGKGGTKHMTACFDYGVAHGCDEDCPALLDGNCPQPAEVLAVLEDRFTYEELEELKDLYNLNHKEGCKSIW